MGFNRCPDGRLSITYNYTKQNKTIKWKKHAVKRLLSLESRVNRESDLQLLLLDIRAFPQL